MQSLTTDTIVAEKSVKFTMRGECPWQCRQMHVCYVRPEMARKATRTIHAESGFNCSWHLHVIERHRFKSQESEKKSHCVIGLAKTAIFAAGKFWSNRSIPLECNWNGDWLVHGLGWYSCPEFLFSPIELSGITYTQYCAIVIYPVGCYGYNSCSFSRPLSLHFSHFLTLTLSIHFPFYPFMHRSITRMLPRCVYYSKDVVIAMKQLFIVLIAHGWFE